MAIPTRSLALGLMLALAAVPFAAASGDLGDVIGPPDPGSGCKPNCIDALDVEPCADADTPEALRPACEGAAPVLDLVGPDPQPCRPAC